MQIESNAAPNRKSPTQRQVEALAQLDQDQLVGKALEALHALNRRAKSKRDQRNEYRRATFAKALDHQVEDIYALKDAFLDALVLGGRAQLYTFTVTTRSLETTCGCGRSWFGGGQCYRCHDDGFQMPVEKRWFVVEGEGYRFHQPSVSSAAATLAMPIPSHDPNQPAREIPAVTVEVQASLGKSKLTIDAQMACVRMATAALCVGPRLPSLTSPEAMAVSS